MTDAPADAATRKGWIPWAVLGAVLVAAAVLLVVFWQRIQWSIWVNGADSPEYQKKLIEETDADLVPRLVAGMRDTSKGFKTRVSLANVLIKKGRLGPLEDALLEPTMAVKVVALRALIDKPFFRKQYAGNATFRIPESYVAWLSDSSLPGREDALDFAHNVHQPPNAPPAFLEAARAILAGSKGPEGARLRQRAAEALGRYRDCAAVPSLVAALEAETESETLRRLMQAVVELHDAPQSPCADVLPEATARKAVSIAFDHAGDSEAARATRMAALIKYKSHVRWLTDRVEKVRTVLNAPSTHISERRLALETLVVGRDDATWEEIPRRAHDPDNAMRGSLILALPDEPDADSTSYEGCLIGLVRDEPAPSRHDDPRGGNPFVVEGAFRRLRRAAGEWVGFPGKLRLQGLNIDAEMRRRIAGLLKGGTIADPEKPEETVTRDQIVREWWTWLAKRNGVTEEAEVRDVEKTRADFWAKAKAGDVLGAKALVEKPAALKRNLWSYERGWLEAREAATR